MFEKIDNIKAYRLLNHGPVVLITTLSNSGKPNIMTLTWLTTINSEPPTVAICMGGQAHSQKSILKTKEFAINIPAISLLKKVLYCGSRSGKDEDKFETAKLTPLKPRVIKPPKIGECFANLECKVISHKKYADVVMFVAEVVYCEVERKMFDDYLKTDIAKTIHHLGGGWFTVPGRRFKFQ